MPKIYAVNKGWNPGVYHSNIEAQKQITKYTGNEWKVFKNKTSLIRYCIDFNWKNVLSSIDTDEIEKAINFFPYDYVIREDVTEDKKFLTWEKANSYATEYGINPQKITRQPKTGDKKIYVVHKGRMPGVYYSSSVAKAQTDGFPNRSRFFFYTANAIGYIKDINRPDLLACFSKNERASVIAGFKKFHAVPSVKVCYTRAGARFVAEKNLIDPDDIRTFRSLEDAEKYVTETKEAKTIQKQIKTISCQRSTKNTLGFPGNKIAEAYVDGSYSERKKDIYGSGIVFKNEKSTEYFSIKGSNPDMLELGCNGGEIMAVWQSVLIAQEHHIQKLYIYTDSTTVQYCMEQKPKKTGMMKFKDFLQKASEQMEIELIKVKAHSGNLIHNKADELAKMAIY